MEKRSSLLTSVIFSSMLAASATAQTEVRPSSFTFSAGVCPTFSVVFNNTDAKTVENWFKDELKSISANVSNKKDLMAVGTRLPEVSSDTIRIYVKGDQPKKSKDVTLHLAFRVDNKYVGPDSDQRQSDGCKNWLYQRAVMLKKELGQKELDAATKEQKRMEDELAGLIKEKDRAQNSIEKTQDRITSDGTEKLETDGSITTMATEVDSKKQEVARSPTEANTKELQNMLKEQEKLRHKSEKLGSSVESGKKKIEDLQFTIKKNLADQDAMSKAIEAQKKVVEDLATKVANIN